MAKEFLTGVKVGGLNLDKGRVLPSVGTTASGATITPVATTGEFYTVTALAADATIAAPTGTPVNGQRLILRIKASAATRALTWNAIYRAIGVTLAPNVAAGKTLYTGMVYNAADTKWDVIASVVEA